MKKIVLGLLSIGLFLASCQKESAVIDQNDSNDQITKIPNQYVVVLKEKVGKNSPDLNYTESVAVMKSEAARILNDIQVGETNVLKAYNNSIRGFAATLTAEQAERLSANDNVAYVLEDKMFTLARPIKPDPTPDPEALPYGIARVGYGDGTGKTAWILDTGIDYDHPDLNVDVARSAFFTRSKSADDDHGHGTHCAGTVAAIDNEIGVIGVAAGATVVAVKVLDRRGSGSFSGIIEGIDYVAANAAPGDAANMSLGGGVYQAIDDAVIAASNKGIYFALAAGNESDDALNHSPARANGPYVWTISAMDINDDFAYFSNYGTPVDYCMPGVNIYSTAPGGGYQSMSGTSMAAPHMCGVLLMTNGNPKTDGYVNNDPDGNPDPIGHI
jgi:subtilisin family serine protease